MPYRNEATGLRMRNDELESELAEAKAKISRLRGERQGDGSWARRLMGGSGTIEIARRLPGTLDDESLGDVLEVLSKRFETGGEVVRVGQRFTWSLPKTFELEAPRETSVRHTVR